MEIDLVDHEGGNRRGEFCYTPGITATSTGWTETKSVRNKAQNWVFAADKDLLKWAAGMEIFFTRSRPYNKNDQGS